MKWVLFRSGISSIELQAISSDLVLDWKKNPEDSNWVLFGFTGSHLQGFSGS